MIPKTKQSQAPKPPKTATRKSKPKPQKHDKLLGTAAIAALIVLACILYALIHGSLKHIAAAIYAEPAEIRAALIIFTGLVLVTIAIDQHRKSTNKGA